MELSNKNIKSIEYTKDVFKLKWRMTGWCNYHCEYCLNRLNQSSHITEDELINTAKKINDLLVYNKVTKPIHLNLLGGEITYYDLPKIISQIANVSNVHITTNFSRGLDCFEKLLLWGRENHIKIFISCSWHSENLTFVQKFLAFNSWCVANKFPRPKATKVITEYADINCIIDNLPGALLERLTFHLEKDPYAQEIKVNTLNLVELEKQIVATENAAKTFDYKITFVDGSTKNFNSILNIVSSLGGFKPGSCYCNAGTVSNGILVNWDGKIFRNQCPVLEKVSIGSIHTELIKLPTTNYKCSRADDICPLCNGVNVYKEIN